MKQDGQHGYDIAITPKGEIDTTPTANDVPKIRFRGTFDVNRVQIERTVLAQGHVAEEIADHVATGQPVMLHVAFARRRNEDGSEGGEYLNVLRLSEPRRKAA